MSDRQGHPEAPTSLRPRADDDDGLTPATQTRSASRPVGPVVVVVLLAVILSYQLLIPPVIGLADQGDYFRIFERFGIQSSISDYTHRYFGYFIRTWAINEKAAHETGFLSPDALLVAVSISLNSLLSKTGVYDVRCLALVRMALFLAAAALILQLAWRRGLLVRCVAVFSLLFVFADVGYVAYLNSGYTEPSSFLFGLLLIAFYLRLAASEGNPWTNLAGFVSSAALLTWGKPQNILIGFVAGLAALRLAQATRTPHWRVGTRLAAAGLVAWSVLFHIVAPPESYRDAIRYIAVFTNLLPFSPHPRQDLHDLGLNPSLATLAGTFPWQKEAVKRQTELRQLFYSRIGDGTLARFYLRHPQRIWTLLRVSAPEALSLRTPYGNFEEAAGLKPYAQAQSFAMRSDLIRRYGPNHLGWLAAWLGVALLAGVVLRSRARTPGLVLATEGIALLVLAAVSQYATVAVLQGPHFVWKQMFLFAFLFDCCLVATVALGAERLDGLLICCQRRHTSHRSAGEGASRCIG